jgi:hypothetical protein
MRYNEEKSNHGKKGRIIDIPKVNQHIVFNIFLTHSYASVIVQGSKNKFVSFKGKDLTYEDL